MVKGETMWYAGHFLHPIFLTLMDDFYTQLCQHNYINIFLLWLIKSRKFCFCFPTASWFVFVVVAYRLQ